MAVPRWIRILIVFLVVLSTVSARFTPDANVAIALFSENSEEKSISESDFDSLAEIFGAVASPLDEAIRVSVTRIFSDSLPLRLHVVADDVSARGPPLS